MVEFLFQRSNKQAGMSSGQALTIGGRWNPDWIQISFHGLLIQNSTAEFTFWRMAFLNNFSFPHGQALRSTRYPTRPELLFCYPNPTRTTFKKFRVSGFSQQAVSQQAASNLLTIILKFCCFLVALTRNPLFN